MNNPTLVTDTGLNQYGVGCTLITQLSLMIKKEIVIIPNDVMVIQVGLEIYNEITQQWEILYTPLGTFYVDSVEEKGVTKSIKAYDRMYKLRKGYFPSTKHTTTYAIANDIANITGLKLKGISSSTNNVNINNEQLEGKTQVGMLSLIAGVIGGHVRISRDGSSIEFIEPTNHGEVYTESDYTTPTLDDATSYHITKLRINYSDKITNDEGAVTDEGYYEVGAGTDANTLELSNPLLKGQQAQATNVLNKIKQLNGYKRFDTTLRLADYRLEPMDVVTYTKGEMEYIVPILYMKMTLTYRGISIETQSPTVAETKSEFSFKGTLTQKVENIYTDIIQVKQLTANKVTTDELEATVATIEKLYATKAEIGELVAGSIVVEDLKVQIAQINEAIITKAEITDLEAINATISNLKAKVAEIDTLIADSVLSEIIQSGSISSDLLNVKDGFIKDAMINSLSASKINSGIINTNNVSVQSENGDMLLQGNLLQFKDKNGKIRIQIGQDTTGNYTFTLYDSTGKGVLINQDGIQSSNAIKDGLIVDANINDNANISGSKLDIASLYEHMNEDGSNTLKASKIYFDDKAQTLDVSFKEMTTKQDELEDTMTTAITDIEVSKGQISQLIQNTTITTSEGATTLKDAYNHTKSTVDSHTVSIAKVESTLNSHNSQLGVTNKEVANLKVGLNGIEAGLSSLEQNVGENYYTKTQTDSAIKVAKDEINLGVSSTYETKANVTSQITSTLNNAKSYADTKKAEAISTASTDATNKVNSAKTELNTAINKKANSTDVYKKTETYTKSETDSKVNIAKDSITQSVANTYETKSESTTKYNTATAIAKAMNEGKVLYTDIAFRNGSNSVNAYNNTGNGNVVVERIGKPSDCPTTSTHCIRITHKGTATPHLGGFHQAFMSRSNAVFIQKFVAKLPIGYTLGTASNAMGDGYTDKWLTSSAGTGKWETYIRQVNCGSTGTFSSGGYVYVLGNTPTTSSPLVWYLASCTAIDITDTDERISNLTTRMSSAESKITEEAITNTVKKNFYTKEQTEGQITSKGYQTASQVQQTVDNIAFKFQESGGYNLLMNTSFKNGLTHWIIGDANNGSFSVQNASSNTWAFPTATVDTAQIVVNNKTNVWPGLVQEFDTIINQDYTLSMYIACHRVKEGWVAVRDDKGAWVGSHRIEAKVGNTGGANLNNWERVVIPFKATTHRYNIIVYVVNAGENAHLWFAQPQVAVGTKLSPYSPNPNEIYQGQTVIDKNGIRVNASNVGTYTQMSADGFYVLKNDGNKLFEATNKVALYNGKGVSCVEIVNDPSANYGNARIDVRGGINFVHNPGVSVGINQILLGNDDRSDAYGFHNMSIRCHNSFGFQDNWGLTNMFFDTRRGRIIMKGALYQNTQTPPATFSMNFDGEDEIYNSGYERSQAIDSVMNLKTGVYVDNDGECCSAIYGGYSELITTEYQDEYGEITTHLNHEALNASLVVTCQEQQKLIKALQQELNEIKEYLKIT